MIRRSLSEKATLEKSGNQRNARAIKAQLSADHFGSFPLIPAPPAKRRQRPSPHMISQSRSNSSMLSARHGDERASEASCKPHSRRRDSHAEEGGRRSSPDAR